MQLQDITPSMIKDAVEAFLEEAWGDLAASHWPKIDFDSPDRDRVLAAFVNDSRKGRMRAFALRLGNRRYPFMKLVLEELLVRDKFFFTVDTHDELDVKETTPDYAEWLAIRDFNSGVKKRVESRWRADGIPTCADVLASIEDEDIPSVQMCRSPSRPLIHLVEDDKAIATGVRRILERRGYRVRVSHCAQEALERLDGEKPDLILSDLEMGEGLTGLELCAKLRARPEYERLPFILATAAVIDPTSLDRIDAFLVKPYEIETLVTFIGRELD